MDERYCCRSVCKMEACRMLFQTFWAKVQGGSTGWADVSTIVPWNMYLAYGDKKILVDQYSSMKKWVDYMNRSKQK